MTASKLPFLSSFDWPSTWPSLDSNVSSDHSQ